jgi:hypothetical protein
MKRILIIFSLIQTHLVQYQLEEEEEEEEVVLIVEHQHHGQDHGKYLVLN